MTLGCVNRGLTFRHDVNRFQKNLIFQGYTEIAVLYIIPTAPATFTLRVEWAHSASQSVLGHNSHQISEYLGKGTTDETINSNHGIVIRDMRICTPCSILSIFIISKRIMTASNVI